MTVEMTPAEERDLRAAYERDAWAKEWNSLPTAIDRVLAERGGISQRAYLIAQLEAHYARVMRLNVVNLVEAARKRDPETPATIGKFLTWTDGLYRDAQEGAEIVMAAHQCPDELLNDLVRWQTNPNWKAAMERAGMTFDTKRLIWEEA